MRCFARGAICKAVAELDEIAAELSKDGFSETQFKMQAEELGFVKASSGAQHARGEPSRPMRRANLLPKHWPGWCLRPLLL
eukprot:5776101-Alexandrium_andersonii.AAC.1